MGQINFLEIFKESFTLVILFFCSILSIAFALERWWFFHKARVDGNELLGCIRKLLEAGKSQEAQSFCLKHPSPLARVLHFGLVNHQLSRPELEELLETKRMEERLGMERYLGILGTMGNTAPFIGLFGTVIGIIKAFRDLALSGTGGPAVVAKGIAEALVATAGGLAVAIPAVICFNYFMRTVRQLSVDMEVHSSRFLILLGGRGGHAGHGGHSS
ncbi:MAG: MotA/TolQ/ExbB proton channel family protein [Elusimicrobia bacterium]|nr:MotA/TolQ/ExbB proton channel family protein [Elusimicrobiota bacterium]